MQPVRKPIDIAARSRKSQLFVLLCISALILSQLPASAAGPTLRPIPDGQKNSSEPALKATTGTLTSTAPGAPKVETKPAAKAGSKAELKADPKQGAKAAPAKAVTSSPVSTKPDVKADAKSEAKKPAKVARVSRGPSMVPPPPPNTPSMLGDPRLMGMGYGGAYGMQVEYMSKDALKDRVKEISIQYKDAAAEYENKKRLKAEQDERAKNFEQLYTEGVVSRRELETSKREAGDSTEELNRLENKYKELKSLMERVNKRLAAFSPTPAAKPLAHGSKSKKKTNAVKKSI